jgi:hypothetical protein
MATQDIGEVENVDSSEHGEPTEAPARILNEGQTAKQDSYKCSQQ